MAERARTYGLSGVEILQFTADGKAFYGTQCSRQPWDADFAELWAMRKDGDAWTPSLLMASYEAMPITLAEDSESADLHADSVGDRHRDVVPGKNAEQHARRPAYHGLRSLGHSADHDRRFHHPRVHERVDDPGQHESHARRQRLRALGAGTSSLVVRKDHRPQELTLHGILLGPSHRAGGRAFRKTRRGIRAAEVLSAARSLSKEGLRTTVFSAGARVVRKNLVDRREACALQKVG